ncbi:MAG: hypothetical protein J7L34_05735, partial [Thermotogaceae bacterium]|nr:hypothetical protein [Thermotogaceae bacterium]
MRLGITLRGFAKKMQLPYSTVRKYLIELEKAGFINLKEGPVGMVIDEKVEDIFLKLMKLLNSGITLDGALKVLRGEKLPFIQEDGEFKAKILEKSDRIENVLIEIRELLQNLIELEQRKAEKDQE